MVMKSTCVMPILKKIRLSIESPTKSKDITTECAMKVIPVELFNALALMCGHSDEVEMENFITQDILNLSHRGGLFLLF